MMTPWKNLQPFIRSCYLEVTLPSITSGHRDTIHSCNSSHYANELLQIHNPQDAEEDPPEYQKRFRPGTISYAAVARAQDQLNQHTTSNVSFTLSSQQPGTNFSQPSQTTLVSSLTNDDLDKLYERLKHHSTAPEEGGLSSDELEEMVQDSNSVIQQVHDEMKASVAELSSQVNTIGTQVSKENVHIHRYGVKLLCPSFSTQDLQIHPCR
jgi:hypothetical protein